MKRRVQICTLVGMALAVFFAAGASPALAYQGDPLTNPTNVPLEQSVLQDIDALPTYSPPPGTNPATGSAYTATQVETGIAEADTIAGTLPDLGVAGLAVGALYTGWKIGTPLGNWIYEKITGDTGAAAVGISPTWTFAGVTAPGTHGQANGSCTNSGSTATTQNAQGVAGSVLFGATGTYPNCTIVAGGYFETGFEYVAGVGSVFDSSWTSGCSCANSQQADSTQPGGILANEAASTPQHYAILRSYNMMLRSLNVQASNATEYAGAAKQDNETGWDNQASVPSSTQVQQGMKTGCGAGEAPSTWTAAQAACHAYILKIINDNGGDTSGSTVTGGTSSSTGGTTFAPFYLPTVLPGETYQEYFNRLAARTWLGAASATDDPMAYPAGSPATQLAPGSVTQITTGTSTIVLYDPSTGQPNAWPTNAPQISTQTQPVSTEKVPDTWVPSPGGGNGSLDFSPFTSMSSTCNFPFGVLCWVTGSVHAMDTTPVAPELNWTLPNVDMGPLGTMTMGQHYDVNLASTSMDTYMGWIRDIESWVLWLGTIWYVGSRLLGLKGGGDPTDAVDESFGAFTE
jgi:hypothetical protein